MAIAEGMATEESPTGGTTEIDSSLKISKETSQPLNPNMMASHGAQASQNATVNGARRTAYAANQHSVSIIGSDIGR